MLALGSNGDAPSKPAAMALLSHQVCICCISPDAPLGLAAFGSPPLSHCMTFKNLFTSLLEPP